MRLRKGMWFGALMSSLMAVTMIGAAPAAAQEPVVAQVACQGGGPDYWLANPWPKPFAVPKLFRQPNGKRAIVRKWTQFDAVFAYRGGRRAEGKIFPGKTLKQVLQLTGNSKKGLARQAIAGLLNAGATPNYFWMSKYSDIREFQVYWDGTADRNVFQSRVYWRNVMADRNAGACPAP